MNLFNGLLSLKLIQQHFVAFLCHHSNDLHVKPGHNHTINSAHWSCWWITLSSSWNFCSHDLFLQGFDSNASYFLFLTFLDTKQEHIWGGGGNISLLYLTTLAKYNNCDLNHTSNINKIQIIAPVFAQHCSSAKITDIDDSHCENTY